MKLASIIMPAWVSASLFAVAPAASAEPASVELGVDRPGADYFSVEIGADFNICKTMCEDDARCQAYTYVHPGVQGPSAVCWLKSAAPPPQASGCCYSGVKQITREIAWDRPGGDYSDFDLPWWAGSAECEAACWSDARCVAFTYVRPHYQGPNPRCWLKDVIPAPTPTSCCDSGTINWR